MFFSITLSGYCSFFIYGRCIVKDPTFPVCGSWEGQPWISLKNRHKTPQKPHQTKGEGSFDLDMPEKLIDFSATTNQKPIFRKHASGTSKARK